MRQSLHEQAIFVAVSEFAASGGKLTIDDVTAHLKKVGLIEIDVKEMERAKGRWAISIHRKRCVAAKDVQQELVHLTEEIVNEDGETVVVPYYRLFSAMDKHETVQAVTREYSQLKRKSKKFFRYLSGARKKFRNITALLPFEIPDPMVFREKEDAQV
jgi:hypothetical protein